MLRHFIHRADDRFDHLVMTSAQHDEFRVEEVDHAAVIQGVIAVAHAANVAIEILLGL